MKPLSAQRLEQEDELGDTERALESHKHFFNKNHKGKINRVKR